jgi:hypothetical protein
MKLNILPQMSLEECADRLYQDGYTDRPLSRERIRQIEQTALNKFVKGMRARGYTDLESVQISDRQYNSPHDRILKAA